MKVNVSSRYLLARNNKLSIKKKMAIPLERICDNNKIGSKRQPSNTKIPLHKKLADDIKRS